MIVGSSFATCFRTSTSFGRSAGVVASIDFVITGSKICLIASKGSISSFETVSPEKIPLSPTKPTMFPAVASSTANLFAPL